MKHDIAVLGAGVVGRMIAYRLAKKGYRVGLYEEKNEHNKQGAGFVAAAMLSPLAEAVSSERYIGDLGVASMALWAGLVKEVSQESGMEIFYQQKGTVVVWHSADRAEKAVFLRQLSQYTPTPPSIDINADATESSYGLIDTHALAFLEPSLSVAFGEAIYLQGEGQVDNQTLMPAMIRAFIHSGGQMFWSHPHTLQSAKDSNLAPIIVDCRGLYAKDEWQIKAHNKKAVQGIRGIRGEVAVVHAPNVPITRPIRLLHPRYPLYIAPKPGGRLVIGATVIESEDASPVSVRSALELLSALYTVHPALAESRIDSLQSACRPTLPDHRPSIVLSHDGVKHNVIQINGLYRHGFLLSPIVVESALHAIDAITHGSLVADNQVAWQSSQAFPPLFCWVH